MKSLEPIGDARSVSSKVYDRLIRYVMDDEATDGRLPPETTLAGQLGVSRTSLREALQRLEAEGYITRKRRVGTVIVANRPRLDAGLERLNSITGVIRDAGMKPGTSFSRLRCEETNALIAQKLHLNSGETVSVLERVRTADGAPFCYDISFIPVRYFTESDMERLGESLFAYLSASMKKSITQVLAHLYPCTADSLTSKYLAVPTDHLLILLEQTHFAADGEPLWYSRTFYRSDVIGFHIVRT